MEQTMLFALFVQFVVDVIIIIFSNIKILCVCACFQLFLVRSLIFLQYFPGSLMLEELPKLKKNLYLNNITFDFCYSRLLTLQRISSPKRKGAVTMLDRSNLHRMNKFSLKVLSEAKESLLKRRKDH